MRVLHWVYIAQKRMHTCGIAVLGWNADILFSVDVSLSVLDGQHTESNNLEYTLVHILIYDLF